MLLFPAEAAEVPSPVKRVRRARHGDIQYPPIIPALRREWRPEDQDFKTILEIFS